MKVNAKTVMRYCGGIFRNFFDVVVIKDMDQINISHFKVSPSSLSLNIKRVKRGSLTAIKKKKKIDCNPFSYGHAH